MHTQRQGQLASALDQIVHTLVTQYQPEKIILFGSMASGEVHEWSDLDLVIIKDTPKPFFQRLKEVALMNLMLLSVDYLVYTPAEFKQMVAEGNLFINEEVVKRGKVLYDRQRTSAVA